MSHFAKVVNGIVTDIMVAEPEFFNTFKDTSPGEWIQTSYNTRGSVHYNPTTGEPSADQSKALRKNFAHLGGIYDRARDAFYLQQPHPSWILNEETCEWEPPVPRPGPTGFWIWNEETQTWDDYLDKPLPPNLF
jgi:hypothetical protein